MNGLRKLLVSVLGFLPLLGYSFDVSAKSAVVMDASTGKILWAKNADAAMYPASTTKIMTALLLLEHCAPNEIITAPADVTNVKEASMHLKPFERVTAQDMLYALLLRSANDGCYAVACHISGSVPAFADLMNKRAKELGCTNTNFHNPNGLNDPLHYTSAHDLALIAREAMKLEAFRDVVKTYKHQIDRSINTKDRTMVSHNKVLPKDPTADGIKTGYTVPAGHCFVGSATRSGFRVITVVLKSDHWQKDSQDMMHWAYANHARMQLVPQNAVIQQAPVAGGVKTTFAVSPCCKIDSLVDKSTLSNTLAHPVLQPMLTANLRAPIKRGQIVGSLIVRDPEGFSQEVPLQADEDVPEALADKPGGRRKRHVVPWRSHLHGNGLCARTRTKESSSWHAGNPIKALLIRNDLARDQPSREIQSLALLRQAPASPGLLPNLVRLIRFRLRGRLTVTGWSHFERISGRRWSTPRIWRSAWAWHRRLSVLRTKRVSRDCMSALPTRESVPGERPRS